MKNQVLFYGDYFRDGDIDFYYVLVSPKVLRFIVRFPYYFEKFDYVEVVESVVFFAKKERFDCKDSGCR